ncbi:hypothetical protein DFR58_115106 [Anaerobacterium chartisolvens]|uniref:Uncharacterized protein n=1 Tax=Anaerobacterium chartisolvens TaxID=1297424 RepID=A0A369AY78_9FIRM|nr:hypothetical protein DFR58_115106 [Anaerobacterium chartisolvens]
MFLILCVYFHDGIDLFPNTDRSCNCIVDMFPSTEKAIKTTIDIFPRTDKTENTLETSI